MDKTTKLVAVIIVVIAAAIGAVVYLANTSGESDSPSAINRPDSSNQGNDDTEQDESEFATVITYTDDGFSVLRSTVRVGDVVQVINNSSGDLDFSSDPHPAHSDQDDLNVGIIPADESRTFTMTEAGTWGFHDHNNHAHSDSITVE